MRRTLNDLANTDIALGKYIKLLRCSSRRLSSGSCSTSFASFLGLGISALLFRLGIAAFLAFLLLLRLSFFLLRSLRLLLLFFRYANLGEQGLERRNAVRLAKSGLHLEDEPVELRHDGSRALQDASLGHRLQQEGSTGGKQRVCISQ